MESSTTPNEAKASERSAIMASSSYTVRVTVAGRHEDTKVSTRAFTYEEAEAMAAQRAEFLGAKTWRVIAG